MRFNDLRFIEYPFHFLYYLFFLIAEKVWLIWIALIQNSEDLTGGMMFANNIISMSTWTLDPTRNEWPIHVSPFRRLCYCGPSRWSALQRGSRPTRCGKLRLSNAKAHGPPNMIPTRDTSKKPTSPHQGNQPPNNRCRSFASTHRHQKPSYRQRLKGHSTKKKTRQSDTTSAYLFVCACLSDWPHPVCRER